MSKIRVLDSHLINKIAAGEVVARPSSVAKELIENALDAGARRIELELEGGGLTLLRISDDGEGMTEAEALLALERHATSKISSEADLADIRTLGFRGEALPSIASVSEMEIRTRPRAAEAGTRVVVKGGTIAEVRPAGATVGTTFVVRDLFFNTPARRKFLRTEATETRHVLETVAEAILGHPDVSFKAGIAGKQPLYSSPGTGKLFDAMVAVLGPATAREMVELPPRTHPELGYRVRGFISRPSINRATRNGFHLFVNGRPVQMPQLARAVADSYHAYLPRGRWPVAVLFVESPPELVDVNVHPQKLEVRLHQPERLAGLLGASVRDVLAGERRPEAVTAESDAPPETSALGGSGGSGAPWSWQRRGSSIPYLPLPRGLGADEPPVPATPAEPGPAGSLFAEPDRASAASLFQQAAPATGGDWVSMRILGQVFRTFLVGVTDGRVWFLDQHTAHERVLYEQAVERFSRRETAVQPLLLPVTIDCPRRSPKELEDLLGLLSACGFECDLFSGSTVVVKSIPLLERGIDVKAVLEELLEEGVDAGPLDRRMDKVAATVSCKAAVKAGDTLSDPEMRSLVRDLGQTANPLRCPHGRPVLLELGETELKRLFERTW